MHAEDGRMAAFTHGEVHGTSAGDSEDSRAQSPIRGAFKGEVRQTDRVNCQKREGSKHARGICWQLRKATEQAQ